MSNLVLVQMYKLKTPIAGMKGKYKTDGDREQVGTKRLVPREMVQRSLDDNKDNPKGVWNNNLYYEVFEEETKELMKERQENIEANAKRKKKESLTQADLIDALAGGKKETSIEEMTKKEVKQLLNDKGIEFDGRSSKEELIKLLKQG